MITKDGIKLLLSFLERRYSDEFESDSNSFTFVLREFSKR
jgi:hypothetical protein